MELTKQSGSKTKNLLFFFCMWFLAILMITPFIMMVIISFRPQGLVYKSIFYPTVPILTNYAKILGKQSFYHWYVNTFVAVTLIILFRLVVTLPASYALSHLKFPGKKILFLLFFIAYMVPPEATMVPRYLFYKNIHLLDSLWVIVIPEISEVLYLMFILEFFREIPKDISEAALIDGAGHRQILLRIFLPLSKPVIATTILFTFINTWNNFLDPFLFIKTEKKQFITPGLQYFQERGGGDIPVQLAGAAMAVIPVIILFTITQKYFIAGIKSTGIKG